MRALFLFSLLISALCHTGFSTQKSITFKFSVRPSNPSSPNGFFTRIIGNSKLHSLDPFLLFDHFKSNNGTGFSDHPHRGFETVTYLLSGMVQHEDFMGKQGKIEAGDTQWMTAGKGVVHAEAMVEDNTEGMQLWVNLKSIYKYISPRYQDLPHDHIPQTSNEGVNVTIIAGESLGIRSPALTYTPAMYLDISLAPGSAIVQPVPSGWNGFLYVHDGQIDVETTGLNRFEAGVMSVKEGEIVIRSKEGGKVLLIAGEPTDEPMIPCGYFVTNTREECTQAERDYKDHTNGFEKAAGWKSETRKLITH